MLRDWLFPNEAQRREERDRRVISIEKDARDFVEDMQERISALQKTAADDRKGYPIASALKRRRPHDG